MIDYFLRGVATAAFLALVIFTSMWCSGDVHADPKPVTHDYIGTFERAEIYRLRITMGECFVMKYPIPMGNTGYSMACR